MIAANKIQPEATSSPEKHRAVDQRGRCGHNEKIERAARTQRPKSQMTASVIFRTICCSGLLNQVVRSGLVTQSDIAGTGGVASESIKPPAAVLSLPVL